MNLITNLKSDYAAREQLLDAPMESPSQKTKNTLQTPRSSPFQPSSTVCLLLLHAPWQRTLIIQGIPHSSAHVSWVVLLRFLLSAPSWSLGKTPLRLRMAESDNL